MSTQDIWPLTGITDLDSYELPTGLTPLENLKQEWDEVKLKLAQGDQLATFTTQLHREWAIETGQIENLYDIDRGVMLTLIEQGFHASMIPHGSVNRDTDYVIALLEDQQAALEGLFSFVKQDRKLSTSYIKELHAAMTRSQPTTEARTQDGDIVEVELLKGAWKIHPNYPERNGTVYRYCPPEHVDAEMERLVQIHYQQAEANVPIEMQAAWLHHRFSQIHPFQDGNGRIARALASLVLIRGGLFPLVIPRDEKDIYIESLERADAGDMKSLLFVISRRQVSAFERATSALRKIG